ncbi:lipooligosaccharide transport system permease protein [Micrococcales bacterium KH10]|nr:lipooligosaccharide transport system permease protein [Micrococcales bacterium KH10]
MSGSDLQHETGLQRQGGSPGQGTATVPTAQLAGLTLEDLRNRALRGGAKPRRYGTWYVAACKFRHQRTYIHTIIWTAIGTPLLYLMAMGLGLGSLVSANMGDEGISGVSYLVFVAPALLVTAAVSVGSEEMTYTILGGFKWNPIYFAMNAAPLAPVQIINGVVISVIARLTFVTTIYYGALLAFGASPSAWGWLTIPIGVLTSLGFNSLIMAYSASIEQDSGQIAMIMRFLVMPLTLFSGTFYPLETMPGYLQPIGWLSPLWHGAQLARSATYGLDESGLLIAGRIAYLVVLTAVGWIWAHRIAARRLNR